MVGHDRDAQLMMTVLAKLWVNLDCSRHMLIHADLDRNNIGNAKTAGLATDLDLSSSDYSLAVSIFFVGTWRDTWREGDVTDPPRLCVSANPFQHVDHASSPSAVPSGH